MKTYWHCDIEKKGHLLKKVVVGSGNNAKAFYELLDAESGESIVTLKITGEWERVIFEDCFREMVEKWDEIKIEQKLFEDKSESPIEKELFQALQGVFPGEIIQQYEFKDGDRLITRPDIYLPEHGICIYCDGHEFHEKTKEQAKRDKSIDRWIQAQGMKSLRFTGSEIFNDSQRCAEEILNFLS